jgi:hypothetical protein
VTGFSGTPIGVAGYSGVGRNVRARVACTRVENRQDPIPSLSGARRRRQPSYVKTLPRLAIGPADAAVMLGVSRDFFDEHIKPELRVVRRGSKMILIPVAELERWLETSAARWFD